MDVLRDDGAMSVLWRELAAAPGSTALDDWPGGIWTTSPPRPAGCQALVHGDISASNLLISDAREVFLIDWAPARRSPGFRAMWNAKMHAKADLCGITIDPCWEFSQIAGLARRGAGAGSSVTVLRRWSMQ